jgi:hypothetical protein
MAVRPITRWRWIVPHPIRSWRLYLTNAATGTSAAEIETARESAATIPACGSAIPSIEGRRLPVYVANFYPDGLRHRGDLRLPGPRPARLWISRESRAAVIPVVRRRTRRRLRRA